MPLSLAARTLWEAAVPAYRIVRADGVPCLLSREEATGATILCPVEELAGTLPPASPPPRPPGRRAALWAEMLQVRLPAGTLTALDALARDHATDRSTVARRLLLRALAALAAGETP